MSRQHTLASRMLRDRSGGSGAELALILPVLTLLMMGGIDIGGMAWTKLQVAAAARAGASYALAKGYDDAGIRSAVSAATGANLEPAGLEQTYGCLNAAGNAITAVDDADKSVPCADGTLPGRYVTVMTQSNYSLLFPGLGERIGLDSNAVALQSTARVRIL